MFDCQHEAQETHWSSIVQQSQFGIPIFEDEEQLLLSLGSCLYSLEHMVDAWMAIF